MNHLPCVFRKPFFLLILWLACVQAGLAQENDAPAASGIAVDTVSTASAEPASGTEASLADFSIEQLMDIPVVSVSRKTERATEVAAAMHVITSEEIRRSGATCLPEALRLAPGVQVERTNTDLWTVSIRGFTDYTTNKLLVLVDGRSVYNPVFSGTDWALQDIPLEDIERIEVLRGPSGAIWGANAVNGVINIITRNAKDTQGGMASIGVGTSDRLVSGVRYGMVAGKNTYVRTYARVAGRDALDPGTKPSDIEWAEPGDNLQGGRTGFRADSYPNADNVLSFQGSFYRQRVDQAFTMPTLDAPYVTRVEDVAIAEDAYLLGRWEHTIGPDSTISLQTWFDHCATDRLSVNACADTADMELVHTFKPHMDHELTWGVGARGTWFDFDNSFQMSTSDPDATQTIYSLFAQDEWRLMEDRLRLVLGARLEDNSHAEREMLQPNARVSYALSEKRMVWGAVSRAAHIPSLIERDLEYRRTAIEVEPGLPLYPMGVADGAFDAETLTAYEVGFRTEVRRSIWLDLCGFVNEYDNILSISSGEPVLTDMPSMYLDAPMVVANDISGQSHGFETQIEWQAAQTMRFSLAYTLAEYDFQEDAPTAGGQSPSYYEGNSPRHQVTLHCAFDLPRNVSLDVMPRYVGAIPEFDYDAYSTLDARLGWRARPNLEVSLTGTNLVDSRHSEGSTFESKRAAFFKVNWTF